MKKAIIVICTIMIFFVSCAKEDTSSSNLPASSGETTQITKITENTTTVTQEFLSIEEMEKAALEILKMVDNETPAEKLITKKHKLEEISNTRINPLEAYFENLYTVDKKTRIECLRKLENGNCYAVFEVEEGGRMFLFFPKEQSYRMSHCVYVYGVGTEADFNNLKIGDKIEKAEDLNFDKGAQIGKEFGINDFSYYNGTNTSLISSYTFHLLKNSMFLIQYDERDSLSSPLFIKSVEKLSNNTIFIPKDSNFSACMSTIGATKVDQYFDFTILPQDYPK